MRSADLTGGVGDDHHIILRDRIGSHDHLHIMRCRGRSLNMGGSETFRHFSVGGCDSTLSDLGLGVVTFRFP
jgi:hypothetical protein